jgi:DNA-binding transcriptional ArsR family regulator
MPISWNSDGTLLVVPTDAGLAILSAAGLTLQRTLAFPMSDFRPGAPNEITYDWKVAWSPRGNAIAALATTSHPSFRLWGLRHTSLGVPMIGLGFVGGIGLALLLREDLLWVVMSPDRAGLLWSRTDPRLRTGRALFLFALASSILYSYEDYALARIYGLQVLPSLGWLVVSILLSIPVVVLAGYVAAEVFHASVWSEAFPRPFSRRASSVFGYVLFPTLLAAGFAQILFGLWLTAVPSLSRVSFSFGLYAIFGIVLGMGFYLSGRLVRGFPWANARLPWIALLLSAGASVLLVIVSVFFLVVALNILRVAPPGGEFRDYGFTILLGFGFVPFAVALVGLATAAASAGLPTVFRMLTGGYSRVQGGAVLELETRRKVFEIVASKPGVHFRQLLATSGLGSGTLHYHLSVLEREGFVTWHREGRKKQFFSALGGEHGPIAEVLRGI